MASLKVVIFDLDGTLLDSRLDFDVIRREANIPQGQPILEYMDTLTDAERIEHIGQIVTKHELRGLEVGELFPGVEGFLALLKSRSIKMGILTRNSRQIAMKVVEKFSMPMTEVLAREDVERPKPDPQGLLMLSQKLGSDPSEMLYFGDYLYDLEAGERAGVKTCLYESRLNTTEWRPDFRFNCYLNLTKNFEHIVKDSLNFSTL